jgi:hypothetical protein
MIDEASVLVGGGTHTTAMTASAIVFLLLTHPHKLEKLKAELQATHHNMDDIPKASQVEQLPYLVSIIIRGSRNIQLTHIDGRHTGSSSHVSSCGSSTGKIGTR